MSGYGSNNGAGRIEYTEPASLTDGEIKRRALAEEISDIAQQLNARKQERVAKFIERHPNGIAGQGRRPSDEMNILSPEFSAEERAEHAAYVDWRKKALGALRARERVLRQLNDWLKAERRRLHQAETLPPEEKDAAKLIGDAYNLFVKLREEDVEFEPEEWSVIERLRGYLNTSQPRKTEGAP